jgi:hypothetical protein
MLRARLSPSTIGNGFIGFPYPPTIFSEAVLSVSLHKWAALLPPMTRVANCVSPGTRTIENEAGRLCLPNRSRRAQELVHLGQEQWRDRQPLQIAARTGSRLHARPGAISQQRRARPLRSQSNERVDLPGRELIGPNRRRTVTSIAFSNSQWKALRTAKTQALLSNQEAVLLPLFGLRRSGQVKLRRLVGWHDLTTVSERPRAA